MRRALAAAVLLGTLAGWGSPARAQEGCGRAVVFTLPGVTWAEVRRERPPALLALARSGAIGSVSMRTAGPGTDLGDAFATIGAGTRAAAPPRLDIQSSLETESRPSEARVRNLGQIRRLAEAAGYRAVPGQLAGALGAPIGAVGVAGTEGGPVDPWVLLAAMDEHGVVARAAAGAHLTVDHPGAPWGARADQSRMAAAVRRVLSPPCSVAIVDQGDLMLAEAWAERVRSPSDSARRSALLGADDLLDEVAGRLDFTTDLLLVVSPTSPAADTTLHLGVALARGPRFSAGESLETASTRRRGIVTLPDVAATVLRHRGVALPATMIGRPWSSVPAGETDRIADAVELDDASRFAFRTQAPVIAGYIALQLAFYAGAGAVLARGTARGGARALVELGALAVVAFPAATLLANLLPVERLGTGGFVSGLAGATAALVALTCVAARRPLDRLLVLTAGTISLIALDLALGGSLQLNAVFGNYPIVGGRFVGLGNSGFAVLGSAAIVCGALVARRLSSRHALAAVAPLFAAVVVVVGAPALGSDVGGVLALVPALGVTAVLLSGRRVGPWGALAAAAASVLFLGAFIVWDLSGPPEEHTHLARLVERIVADGAAPLLDAIGRKVSTNLAIFGLSAWSLLVPPAFAGVAWALLSWPRLRTHLPAVRVAVVGLTVLAALGFLVNDSGITIPAMVLAFMVPTALLAWASLPART